MAICYSKKDSKREWQSDGGRHSNVHFPIGFSGANFSGANSGDEADKEAECGGQV
jgi:hypothetical protein